MPSVRRKSVDRIVLQSRHDQTLSQSGSITEHSTDQIPQAKGSTATAPFAFLLATLFLANSSSKLPQQLSYDGSHLYVGTGLDGHVSRDRGFLGCEASQRSLPVSLQCLETVHGQLPILLRRGTVREAIHLMPPLHDGLNALAQEHTARAALLLSTLAHAYYFAPEVMGTAPLPLQIDDAWVEICRRLRRKVTGRVMADDILNNARVLPGDTDYRLASSAFDNIEERSSSGVQGAMELNFAPALPLMAEAQNCVLAEDAQGTAVCLEQLSAVIRNCSTVFLHMTPQAGPQGFDPVIWAKTFLPMGKAIREGELGNSGVDTPLFQALDCFLGREVRQDDYGGMQHERRKTLPLNIQKLLKALRAPSVALRPFVEKSDSVRLRSSFDAILQLYVRLLECHRVKAVGMTGVLLRSGHESTTGIKSGEELSGDIVAMSPTEMLSQKIKAGIKSRLGSSEQYQTATVSEMAVVEAATFIALSFENALPLEAGDRIQVWPRNSHESIQRVVSLLEQTFGKDSIDSIGEHHLDRLAYNDLHNFEHSVTGRAFSLDEVMCAARENAPRFYSIGSVFPDSNGLSKQATLTIGHGRGVSATYMTKLREGGSIRTAIHPHPRFNAPHDPAIPLILIGQGITGIGPFLGFLDARARSYDPVARSCSARSADLGPLLLYIAFKAQQLLAMYEHLVRLTAQLPQLSIQLALSGQANPESLQNRHPRIRTSASKITALLQQDSSKLHTLRTHHSAHVFICGSTDFGISVRRALGKAPKNIALKISRNFTAPAPTDWRRWHEDLFGSQKRRPERRITASELAQHNAFDNCWTALDGVVYDLTRYLSLHPGGSKTLMESAGTACDTRFYETHGGEQLQEVFGRLGAYAIGLLDGRKINGENLEVLDAIVRSQNALTNNTAFPVDRKVPFYVYCDALSLHVEHGLAPVRCALGRASVNDVGFHEQEDLLAKYSTMKARYWQQLRSTTSLKQLEAKEIEIREIYLGEAAGLHRVLDEMKQVCA